MKREFPATHEYIDHLIVSGQARPLHPDPESDGEGPAEEHKWIHRIIYELDLDEKQTAFLNALGAGHTIADAARLVGETPRWGRDGLRAIRNRAEGLL